MVWVFLHIITLFAAVAVFFGIDIILHRVARSGDVRAIRNIFGAANPLLPAAPILFVLGGIFGIVAAVDRGFRLSDTWLVIAFIIFPIALKPGGTVGSWARNVLQAADSSPGETPSDELKRLIHDQTATYAAWFVGLTMVIIIYVMVVKPFSYGKGLY